MKFIIYLSWIRVDLCAFVCCFLHDFVITYGSFILSSNFCITIENLILYSLSVFLMK